MSNHLIVGETYVVKRITQYSWASQYAGIRVGDKLRYLRRAEAGDHWYVNEAYPDVFIVDTFADYEWCDEQCAMREVTPVAEDPKPEGEWRLPAGTFFRVNGKHEPLYLVMSNSHVFNLTAKQMHTTCSSRFKDKQLDKANVSMSEVL